MSSGASARSTYSSITTDTPTSRPTVPASIPRSQNNRLNPPAEKFSLLVGNPPFGTDIKEGETDQLGANSLANFKISAGKSKIDSEQVILERAIDLLEPGGRLRARMARRGSSRSRRVARFPVRAGGIGLVRLFILDHEVGRQARIVLEDHDVGVVVRHATGDTDL